MERETFALLSPGKDENSATFHKVDGSWVELFVGFDTFTWSDTDEDVYGMDGPFDVYHLVERRSGVAIGRGLTQEDALEQAERNVRLCEEHGGLEKWLSFFTDKFGVSPSLK